MEEKLRLLLDYQLFEQNDLIKQMLDELDNRYGTTLPMPVDDDDLQMNAAGEDGYLRNSDDGVEE